MSPPKELLHLTNQNFTFKKNSYMKKLYLFFAFSIIMGFAIGQKTIIRCYSQEHLQHQIKQDPERGKRLEALDNRVDEIIADRSGPAAKGKPGGTPRSVVYIPVVVNVVYRTATENISDAQIQSQIDVLNKDFTSTNKEILNPGSYNFAGYFNVVADCKIRFCLYKVVRKSTTVTSFNPDDAMKKTALGGQDPLNPATMLNIWSCNIGGGILGYAQFPGGRSITDGVVILYSAFGTSTGGATETPYDEGRTATHEIGHWLGLRHIWGDRQCGNDFVKDTPEQDGPNFDCPVPGLTSTCKRPVPEQYMNYMDYVVDLCMYMFTKGQLSRMDGYIAASRSPYCLNTCPAPALAKTANSQQNRMAASLARQQLLVYPTVTGDITNLVIPSGSGGRGDIVLLSQSGAIVKRQRVVLTSGNTYLKLNLSDLPNGIYLIKVVNAEGRSETQKLVVQH